MTTPEEQPSDGWASFDPEDWTDTIDLTGPGDVVAAVPLFLGYHPRDSLIAVCLDGNSPRGLLLVVRHDLPADPEPTTQQVVRAVTAHVLHARPEVVVLAVFTGTAAPPSTRSGPAAEGATSVRTTLLARPGEPTEVVNRVADELDMAGVEVLDVLLTDGRFWRSVHCRDITCCPPEGRAVPDLSGTAMAARAAASGLVVHDDIESLAATLDRVGGRRRAALTDAFDREAETLRRELGTSDRSAQVRRWSSEVNAAVRARQEQPMDLEPSMAARLTLLLTDLSVRDAAVSWIGTRYADAAEGLWLELVRAADPGCGAAPATLLALYAYARGHGTYARLAAQRALEDDPEYSMAALVAQALSVGAPPSLVSQMAEDARAERRLARKRAQAVRRSRRRSGTGRRNGTSAASARGPAGKGR